MRRTESGSSGALGSSGAGSAAGSSAPTCRGGDPGEGRVVARGLRRREPLFLGFVFRRLLLLLLLGGWLGGFVGDLLLGCWRRRRRCFFFFRRRRRRRLRRLGGRRRRRRVVGRVLLFQRLPNSLQVRLRRRVGLALDAERRGAVLADRLFLLILPLQHPLVFLVAFEQRAENVGFAAVDLRALPHDIALRYWLGT